MISFLSYNAQWVLISTLLLGLASGLIGTLSYWKRQSLMSDALSHAALPGVIIGFLVAGTKNMPLMLLGAAISALLGAWLIQGITSASRIKPDAAMGIILSMFFGLGIMLLTFVNRMPGGSKSGLDHFIFGQAAAMVSSDVYVLSAACLVVILIVLLFYKEWKVLLFDPSFAQGIGISVRWLNAIYTMILVLIIVIGIQAVGVILMAALLIIPSVSARYWAHTFSSVLIISACIGGISGAVGTYISTLGSGWPTGPFIVLTASAIFVISLAFGKSKGLVTIYLLRKKHMFTRDTQAKLQQAERGELV